MVYKRYVCDRCGKTQESPFKTVGKFGLVDNEIADKGWGMLAPRYDICEECQKALEDFMDGSNLI